MATYELCTIDDMRSLWSEPGVLHATDDDADGLELGREEGYARDAIRRASAEVLELLCMRYLRATLTGPNPPSTVPGAVRWLAAPLAVYYLTTRSGRVPPDPVIEQYQRIASPGGRLEEIARGRRTLCGVPGPANVPHVTNYVIDTNYRSAKARRLAATSTDPRPAPPARTHDDWWPLLNPWE